MLATAVPEAPIHKNCETCSNEDEIGFAFESLVSVPSLHTVFTEDGYHFQFRCFVPLGLNCRHHHRPHFR